MKTHRFYLLFIFSGWIASAFAQTPEPTASTNGPVLTFNTNRFGFGKINEGDIVNCTFIASNAGNQTLEIRKVTPGCHCTTPGDWTHKIEPGKTGVIPLRLDSHGQHGDIHRNVRVDSNDRFQPTQILLLEGTVARAISAVPDIAFIQVHPNAHTNSTVLVHITNELAAPVTLSDVKCDSKSFSAELKTNQPGRAFEMLITALPPFVSNQNNVGVITIQTSSTNLPVLRIQAFAVPQPN